MILYEMLKEHRETDIQHIPFFHDLTLKDKDMLLCWYLPLAQAMAWCWAGIKPLLMLMIMMGLMTHVSTVAPTALKKWTMNSEAVHFPLIAWYPAQFTCCPCLHPSVHACVCLSGVFQLLSQKVLTQITSNLVYVYVYIYIVYMHPYSWVSVQNRIWWLYRSSLVVEI